MQTSQKNRPLTPLERLAVRLLRYEGVSYSRTSIMMGVAVQSVQNACRGLITKAEAGTPSPATAEAIRLATLRDLGAELDRLDLYQPLHDAALALIAKRKAATTLRGSAAA